MKTMKMIAAAAAALVFATGMAASETESISFYNTAIVCSAEGIESVTFRDVDGNEVEHRNGLPTAYIFGRPECWNTRNTLSNIAQSNLIQAGQFNLIYADCDDNGIEKVKNFRDTINSDKISFCSPENSSVSFKRLMWSFVSGGGSVTLPVIAYYGSDGTFIGTTQANQQAEDIYKTLTTGKLSEGSKEKEPKEDESKDEPIDVENFRYTELSDGTIEISGYDGKRENVVIPSEIDGKKVTSLGNEAFAFDHTMEGMLYTKIVIPDTVTKIGDMCFHYQYKLNDIEIPSSVTGFGEYALNVTGWMDQKIQETGLVIVNDIVIEGYLAGKAVRIPDGTKAIGIYAFSETKAERIYFPDSIETIDEEAFGNTKDIVFYCSKGSVADIFAKSHGFEVSYDIAAFEVGIEPDLRFTNNIDANNYVYYSASPVSSYMYENADGTYTLLQGSGLIYNTTPYDDEYTVSSDGRKMLSISNYDPASGKITAKKQIDDILPIWGGVHIGSKYNFVVSGDFNPDEDDEKTVVRVDKYSKNWEHLGRTEFSGISTYLPFRAGCVRMAERGDELIIHTSHQMYRHSDGKRHQSNMTFSVDMESMEGSEAYYGVYTSHSFDQYVLTDNNDIYFLDLGDAYPRSLVLNHYTETRLFSTDLITITGKTGDNQTGMSVGGFELAGKDPVVFGTSIDYKNGGSLDGQRNIFFAPRRTAQTHKVQTDRKDLFHHRQS